MTNRPRTATITPLRRFGRFWGYLIMVAVWTAITVLAGFITMGLLPTMLLSEGTLAEAEGLQSTGDKVMFVIMWSIIIAPLVGWICMAVVGTCAANLLLSLAYVGRALRPSFAAEPLSYSRWTRPGAGPQKTMQVASLLPVRPGPVVDPLATASTQLLTVPNRWTYLSGTMAAIAYLPAVVIFAWPLGGAAAAVAGVAAATIVAAAAASLAKGFRTDTVPAQ